MKEGLGIELTDRQIQVIKDHKESYSFNEPSPATWQKLADFFGVWVGYLVGATDRRVR